MANITLPKELTDRYQATMTQSAIAEREYLDEMILRMAEAKEQIERKLLPQKDKWDSLKKEVSQIVDEMSDLKVSMIAAKLSLKYPLGSKLKLNPLVGYLELVTRFSKFSKRGWCPSPGSLIVRLLKKDGTPGLNFVGYYPDTSNWELVK